MTKAKTLDRLELTRKKFGMSQKEHVQQEQQEEHGLKVCPNCGSKALRLDGGCMSCLSCGWSACHNSQEVRLLDKFMLGASIFFFATSIALNAYSYKLLNRSIDVLRFILCELDKLQRHDAPCRPEGTD